MPSPRLLAAARVLVGLSQKELAAEAGVSATVIGRYKSGATTLRSNSLDAILTALRRNGVRLVDPTEEVAMGVVLLHQSKGQRKSRARSLNS